MSRTSSKTLTRLCIGGVAAATIGGALVLPFGTANAATRAVGDTISIAPTSSTASAGTCRAYTVNVKDAAGANAQARSVTVRLTERTPAGQVATESFDVAFCAPQAPDAAAGTVVTPAAAQTDSTTAADTDTATFATDAQGNVTFGVVGAIGGNPQTGTADILAFIDDSTANGATANNQVPNAGEQTAASSLTVTAGGTATGATTPGSKTTANEVVRGITLTPPSQIVVANSGTNNVTVQATLKNAAGDTVIGATPTADVTGANDTATISCSQSDNNGVSTCQYTAPNAGNDNILVYVNQFGAGNGATPPVTTNNDSLNSGEPSATAAATAQAPQAVNTTVLLQCATNRTVAGSASTVGTNNTGTQSECEAPLSQTTEVFTATVRDAAGTPVSGALVNFAIASNTAGVNESGTDVETLSASQALTDASGVATTTLTNAKPSQGERIAVSATITRFIAGTTGPTQAETSTSRVTFRNPTPAEARNIVVSPASDTVTVGGVRQITATATDRFGRPVQGVGVNFAETGTGRFTNGDSSVTRVTNASGVASIEVTTQSNEAPGQETVTATIVGYDTNGDGTVDAARDTTVTNNDECEQPTGITLYGQNGTAPGNVQQPGLKAGNCAATSTINFVAGAASPSPTATTGASATPTATSTPTSGTGGGTPTPTNTPNTPQGPISATVSPTTITPGVQSVITVTGAPGTVVELVAYSRPN
ncbi:MAG: hypothetical protein JWN17_1810, partial [Frankiales bacterium]|nr:hypothetical protein [Frankiales bacterium]